MSVATPVPPRVHFLWTGSGFALGHRLAIESVLLTNPGLDVTLHVFGQCPASTELDATCAHPRVTLRRCTPQEVIAPCDEDGTLWQTYQRIPGRAASAQSNLLRYAILWQEGGIYLDLDVLVLRALAPLRTHSCTLGEELVWRADEARVAGELAWWMAPPALAFAAAQALRRGGRATGALVPASWHRWLERRWSVAQPNNAVIAAEPRAPFLRALLARAPHVDATVRFRLGPTLVSEVARQHPTLVRLLPPPVLYCVPPSQSFRFFREPALPLPAQALLVHYVSSNHRRELALLALRGPDALAPSVVRTLATEVLAGRAPALVAAAHA